MLLLVGGREFFDLLLDLGGHLDSLLEGDNDGLAPLVAAGELRGGEVRVENRKCSFLFHL
jgi:hypothetical protein